MLWKLCGNSDNVSRKSCKSLGSPAQDNEDLVEKLLTEGLNSLDAIKLIHPDDLPNSKISKGQRKLIIASVQKLDNALAISKELLTGICVKLSEICSSHYETLLFKAAFTLAYYRLLRVSELVYTGPMYMDRPLRLCVLLFTQ